MSGNPYHRSGLIDEEVLRSRATHGRNTLDTHEDGTLPTVLKGIVTEPMFLLLAATSTIYFVLGETREGLFMSGAILAVAGISFFQDSRSRRALAALRAFSEPKATVIRNGELVHVPVEDVVVGDLAVAEEGSLLAADGSIVQSNDLSVNESILTGEAFAVPRNAESPERAALSKGTQVTSGLALYRVTAVGMATRLGRIGASLTHIDVPRTPLQVRIARFVRHMAIAGAAVFLAVWGVAYLRDGSLFGSLLTGLTLAMSILPEEIPVAFTTFLALGAWRLARKEVIVKRATTVETLGSATVICTDKTGTITENRMALHRVYVHRDGRTLGPDALRDGAADVIATAMWASEPIPFDPMEQALHEAYARTAIADARPGYRLVHEYPIGGRPPMMTHVFENAQGERIIACKGAPERVLRRARLSEPEREAVRARVESFAGEGLRVLAVARAHSDGDDFPADQDGFDLEFMGLVAFHDPPKANIAEVFQRFHQAGIRVKIITGDNATTTLAIARQTGFRGADRTLDGEALLHMDDAALRSAVEQVHIFTRMFPEAKLRIVETLKDLGHVVAMTGDGVNDGPALKAAHIGIAMGTRGSDLARDAADLILTTDDLARMVDAVAMGRTIYGNLKKAIQYIISIHIPIILTVSLPLFLGWAYPSIFTPMHVIFLELIMGPTCSIAYENEPLGPDGMRRPPRPAQLTFLGWRELWVSILQGSVIAAGALGMYRLGVRWSLGEDLVRTLVFVTLIVANVGLTFVDRSFTRSVVRTFAHRNPLLHGMVLLTLAMLAALLAVPMLRAFFHLAVPTLQQFITASTIGLASVLWFEGYKWARRRRVTADG